VLAGEQHVAPVTDTERRITRIRAARSRLAPGTCTRITCKARPGRRRPTEWPARHRPQLAGHGGHGR
jgi:hypothetical protein